MDEEAAKLAQAHVPCKSTPKLVHHNTLALSKVSDALQELKVHLRQHHGSTLRPEITNHGRRVCHFFTVELPFTRYRKSLEARALTPHTGTQGPGTLQEGFRMGFGLLHKGTFGEELASKHSV
eukprot:2585052-Amphidinium_carterae.1